MGGAFLGSEVQEQYFHSSFSWGREALSNTHLRGIVFFKSSLDFKQFVNM